MVRVHSDEAVWQPAPLNSPPWWYERLTQSGRAAPGNDSELGLHALLEKLPLSDLRKIARQRGWSLKGTTRSEILQVMAPLLADPTEVARAVTCLPDHLREALRAALVTEDGSGITSSGLAQTVTALRGTLGVILKPVEAAGMLQDLAGWGLLIPWRDSPGNVLHYLFPWEIQRHLPPLPGWCHAEPETGSASIMSQDKSSFISLLYSVWEHLCDQPRPLRPLPEPPQEERALNFLRGWCYDPREVQERQLANTTLRTLSVPPPDYLLDDAGLEALSPLTDGDVEQLEFVCRLLCELDLVSTERGYLLTRSEVMTRFLRCSAAEQAAVVAQACMSLLDWSELDVLLRTNRNLVLRRLARHLISYREFRSELVRMHHMLLRFLATSGESGWYTLDETLIALRALWPELQHPLESDSRQWLGPGWWLAWRQDQRELHRGNEQDWDTAQGGILCILLQGPLYWIGLVDLALEGNQLHAFRPRGLYDWVWDRSGSEAELITAQPSLSVDEATRTIVVHPASVPPQAHTLLGRVARLESTLPGYFVYRLDAHVTHATFEHGETLADLRAAWEHVMPVPMPAMVDKAISEWWSHYGQVRLYEGLALIELEDDVTLRELEASTSIGAHIVARLSPRLVLVRDGDVDVLLQELSARGLTPKEAK